MRGWAVTNVITATVHTVLGRYRDNVALVRR